MCRADGEEKPKHVEDMSLADIQGLCLQLHDTQAALAESEKKRIIVIELYGTAELLIVEKDKRIEELEA